MGFKFSLVSLSGKYQYTSDSSAGTRVPQGKDALQLAIVCILMIAYEYKILPLPY